MEIAHELHEARRMPEAHDVAAVKAVAAAQVAVAKAHAALKTASPATKAALAPALATAPPAPAAVAPAAPSLPTASVTSAAMDDAAAPKRSLRPALSGTHAFVNGAAPLTAAAPAAPAALAVPQAPIAGAPAAVSVPIPPEAESASWLRALSWSVLVQTFWQQCSSVFTLLQGLSFAMVVKAGCISSNVLFQVSPLPDVKVWRATKSTGGADSAPYVSIALSGCQWCFYGTFATIFTQNSSFLVLVWSNVLGAVLGVYYVVTFYRNCQKVENKERMNQYMSAVFSLALLQACAAAAIPAARALSLAGMVGSFCSFLSALSMLVSLPAVIEQKDSSDLPGGLLGAGLFSAVCWFICGRLLNDPMVTYPNLFAIFASGSALGVKLRYMPSVSKASTSAKVIKMESLKQDVDVPMTLSLKKGQPLKGYTIDGQPLSKVYNLENGSYDAEENVPLKAKMMDEEVPEDDAIIKGCVKRSGTPEQAIDEAFNSGTGGTF